MSFPTGARFNKQMKNVLMTLSPDRDSALRNTCNPWRCGWNRHVFTLGKLIRSWAGFVLLSCTLKRLSCPVMYREACLTVHLAHIFTRKRHGTGTRDLSSQWPGHDAVSKTLDDYSVCTSWVSHAVIFGTVLDFVRLGPKLEICK